MPKSYIEFKLNIKGAKTDLYFVVSRSSGEFLGMIRWHTPCRQYVFLPHVETIWNTNCLEEIQVFIKQLMEDKKESSARLKAFDKIQHEELKQLIGVR